MMGNRLSADIDTAVAALLRWIMNNSNERESLHMAIEPEFGALPEYDGSDDEFVAEPAGFVAYVGIGDDFSWRIEASSGVEPTIEQAIYQALVVLGERVKG